MTITDEMQHWVKNPEPLRKPEPSQEPLEDYYAPLNQHCRICQMPLWLCECE